MGFRDSNQLKEESLPRRDWVLLPLISLSVVVVLSVATEAIARRTYASWEQGKEACRVFADPYIGVARPADCSFRSKKSETVPQILTYNDRGYRDDANLTAKAPGTFRIVLVGTSFTVAEATSKDKLMATLLPLELSKRTGRKIELYNEGVAGYPGLPQNVDRRFPDVLAAQPDLILWGITRWDIKDIDATAPEPDIPASEELPERVAVEWQTLKHSLAKGQLKQAAPALLKLAHLLPGACKDLFLASKSDMMLRSELNGSPSQLVNSYLQGPDYINGFLKSQYSQDWDARLSSFDRISEDILSRAAAAKLPVVAMMLPVATQAQMASLADPPAGWDAFKLDREVRSIITKHGGTFVDILSDYRGVADPAHGYLPVDGHPNAEGNANFTRFVADGLMDGAVPSLTGTAKPDAKY